MTTHRDATLCSTGESMLSIGAMKRILLWCMAWATAANGQATFVYGVQNAEDLVRLGTTPWVITSHLNFNFFPPYEIGLGPLEAVRIDTHEVHRLYPTAESAVDWDRRTYPDCREPPQ